MSRYQRYVCLGGPPESLFPTLYFFLVELQKKAGMGWPTHASEQCPEPPECHTWCAMPFSIRSELQRHSRQPHPRGAQPSDSSSLEFIQHIHSPKAMCSACVQESRDMWDILVCHKSCTPSSGGNFCFLNAGKPWNSADVFIQFCIWALMTPV